MFLFLFYGDVILKIIFERGKFSGIDIIMTSKALFFYSLSIVFYASYSILNKIIYSAGLIEKLLYITLGGIAIKILLNFLFVESMQQNGLALSTSISYIFFFFTSLILIYRRFSFKNKTFFFKELIFHLFNGLISLFIVKQISIIYQVNTFFILAEISLFLTIYILNIFLFKTTSTQIITGFFKNIKII
jgi:putative peptidoglycan lipid II flippase